MSWDKKVVKVQEFMANSPEVLCSKFTLKGPGLLATGGTDCRVGIWRSSGGYRCLASFTGAQAPVSSVVFSPIADCDSVVGGDMSGALRIWDVQQQKMISKYASGSGCHKAAVTSLDYHPFGEFFVSSGADGNVKVWDLRKKTNLQTYKYQEGKEAGVPTVSCVKFSPDGRMVTSGNAHGTAILWDLTAGKRFQTIRNHNASITGVDYHPQELMLALSSKDGVVSFWDLEQFKQISSTNRGSYVHNIQFSSDGSALLAARESSLDVVGWKSPNDHVHDSIPHNCGAITSTACYGNTLYACNFVRSFVSIYSVKLNSLSPFSSNGRGANSSPDDLQTDATPSDQPAIPRAQSASSHTRAGGANQQQDAPVPITGKSKVVQRKSQDDGDAFTIPSVPQQQQGSSSINPPPVVSPIQGRSSPVAGRSAQYGRRGSASNVAGGQGGALPSAPVPCSPLVRRNTDTSLLKGAAAINVNPPIGVPANSTPTSSAVKNGPPSNSSNSQKPEESLAKITHSDGQSFQQILSYRVMHLRVLKSLWANDPRAATVHLLDCYPSDPGIAGDFLGLIGQPKIKKSLTVEMCCMLMTVISDLLHDNFEQLISSAVRAARCILALHGNAASKATKQPDYNDIRVENYQTLAASFSMIKSRLAVISEESKIAGDESQRLVSEIKSLGFT